jgi:hypothetical protein
MTPGAATGNNEVGPELIKRARTVRFEGRFDKGNKQRKEKSDRRNKKLK